MRVANIFNDGRVGGPQRRIVQIAKSIRHDVDTIMFFPYMGEDLISYAEDNDVSYVTVSLSRIRLQNPVINALKYIVRFPYEVFQLKKKLKQNAIDLIHVNGIFTIQPLIAARLAGIPAVWHFNDTTLSSRIYTSIRITFGWLAAARAYSAKRVLVHYGDTESRKTEILYPPVDLTRFHPNVKNINALNLEKKPEELLILAVGNVNYIKGYIYLIRALGKLGQQFPNWKLVIVGAILDTNKKTYDDIIIEIKKYNLTSKVVFLGLCNDMPAAYSQCDIYVCSSLTEAGPMVVLEALASGKPVITTDVGLVDEAIVNGKNGIVIPPGDSSQLCTALQELLGDKKRRDEISKHAIDSLTGKFTLDDVGEATLNLYNRILD